MVSDDNFLFRGLSVMEDFFYSSLERRLSAGRGGARAGSGGNGNISGDGGADGRTDEKQQV